MSRIDHITPGKDDASKCTVYTMGDFTAAMETISKLHGYGFTTEIPEPTTWLDVPGLKIFGFSVEVHDTCAAVSLKLPPFSSYNFVDPQ